MANTKKKITRIKRGIMINPATELYLKDLLADGENVSRHIEELIQNSKGFKLHLKKVNSE